MSAIPVPAPARRLVGRAGARAVELGVPPSWFGYRWMPSETVADHFARHRRDRAGGTCEMVHEPTVADNPLPRNVAARDQLPSERGWWGYSMRDVPDRRSGETFVATLPGCRVAWYRDPAVGDDFYPAIVTGDRRALELREVRFRPRHAEVLRSSRAQRLERATWILERVYHNHSHWLTAHLPKLLLLRERGELGDVLLPPELTATMEGTLRLLGFDLDGFRRFDPARPLEVDQLTFVGNDRFRPELLRAVQAAFGRTTGGVRGRRVYISRAGAARRRLVNESEVWPVLAAAGFERVAMEGLTVAEQVALMAETTVLCGAHGAGLTNMVFCRPGTHVIEIADLGFPNPNFYATSAALQHPYWLIDARPVGAGTPLERDLWVEPGSVAEVLDRIDGELVGDQRG